MILIQISRFLSLEKSDSLDLDLATRKPLRIATWKLTQVDPAGRNLEQHGRCTFSLSRVSNDWKIVAQHFSPLSAEDAAAE